MRNIANSPEIIRDTVLEMDDRLNGTWVGTEADEQLQTRFWELLKGHKDHGVINGRIGAHFLRKHKHLLNRHGEVQAAAP